MTNTGKTALAGVSSIPLLLDAIMRIDFERKFPMRSYTTAKMTGILPQHYHLAILEVLRKGKKSGG